MRACLHHHVQSFVATVRRLARTPLATALNALVIGVTFALPLGAWVVVVNLERPAGHLGADPQLSVFLATDAVRADAARVEAALKGAPGVRSFRFVPRVEALAEISAPRASPRSPPRSARTRCPMRSWSRSRPATRRPPSAWPRPCARCRRCSQAIVEGIEVAEDLRAARRMGIAMAQGWFIGRPQAMPA